MLPKRLLLGTLLLTALGGISGCASTGKYEIDPETQYSHADDTCIRCGHRRGTYDYNRCMEKILKTGRDTSVREK